MSRWLIYALVDPRSKEWRYIGKSSEGLARPRRHLKHALEGSRGHRFFWIRALRRLGLAYEIEVLEEHAAAEALGPAEREWIASARAVGVRLTNATDGGEGAPGYRHTEEDRAKMRGRKWSEDAKVRAKGRRFSEETRKKMSEGAKRRGRPANFEKARAKLVPGAGGRAQWASLSPGQRKQKMSAMRVAFGGHTDEHKKKVSEDNRKRWALWEQTGRAQDIRDKIAATKAKKAAQLC